MARRRELTRDTPVLIHTVSTSSAMSLGPFFTCRAHTVWHGYVTHQAIDAPQTPELNWIPVGVFSDNAAGMHPTSTIYSDADVEQMASLSPNQLHRSIDLAVLDADSKGASSFLCLAPSASPVGFHSVDHARRHDQSLHRAPVDDLGPRVRPTH